jgi:methyl-accepting chemotaxis protein
VRDIHAQVRDAYETLRALSTEILAATEQQASGAAEQAAAVAETSATLEELAQTSKQIADNSESVASVAERTLASAEEGMTAVADTAEGIDEIRTTTMQSSDRILQLGERSQEIGRVLNIIDEIAEQTKILALNAAIEAARAGEAGRGFSVVAEEIRQLADSVTESTQEIDRVVREIQTSSSALVMATEKAQNTVEGGRALIERTGDALSKIVANVEQTTDSAKQISVATRQQRTASDQVVGSMKEISLVSQQSAETSRQVSAAIQDLSRITDTLKLR